MDATNAAAIHELHLIIRALNRSGYSPSKEIATPKILPGLYGQHNKP